MKKSLRTKILAVAIQILIFSGGVVAQPASWAWTNTGSNHTILIPDGTITINGSPIAAGDYIGVFFLVSGNPVCGGYIDYNPGGGYTALSAWGDDSTTPVKDGFSANEAFNFKVWRASFNDVISMTASFDQFFPNTNAYVTNGMSALVSLTGTAQAALSASTSVTNSGCFGTCTGSVNLTVTGGTAPYSYLWSNGATTEDLANLCAGTYSVTVTGGGTTTASATVISSSAITVTLSSSNVSCNGGTNGTITTTASGGNSPFTYQWSTGATTQNLTNLAAGTYTVTVRDVNNCSGTQTAVITAPSAITASIVETNVTVFGGNNGAADLTVSGGVGSYVYLWSNAATTQDVSGLSAGTFSVTITDGNGCNKTASVTITQPTIAPLTISSTSTNANCFGQCNGSVDVTVSGGTAPYSYAWSNGASSQDVNGLCPGTYSVTVTDAAGTPPVPFNWTYYMSGINHTILIPDGSILINGSPIQNGDYVGVFYLDGAVQKCGGYIMWEGVTTALSAWGEDTSNPGRDGFNTGETFIFKVWKASVGQVVTMTANFDGVSFPNTGTYSTNGISGLTSLTGTLASGGQSATASFTITQPTALSASIVGTNVSVFGGSNGSADLTVTGGTAPYSYLWSNGAQTQDVNGLIAGVYYVTVVDSHQCSTSTNVLITQPQQLLVSGTVSNVNCSGTCDGAIDVSVEGGIPPYTYVWSNGGNSQDLSNLCMGTYGLTVIDAGGAATASFQVSGPSALVIFGQPGTIYCHGETTDILIAAQGGTAPYSGTGTFSVGSGIHSYSVTDAHGCSGVVTVTVTEPAVLAASAVTPGIACFGGFANVTVSATGGTAPYFGTGQYSLQAGTYVFTVTDNNGCEAITPLQIGEPALLQASSSNTAILCHGGNALVTVNALGGTAPYTGTGQFSVTAGTYSYTVTDANNCTASTSIVVVEPSALSATVVYNPILCFGGSTSVVVTGTGGTPPYTGTGTFQKTAGSHSFIVMDANGCSYSANVQISEPPQLVAASSASPILCNGGSSVVNVSATGGTPPYSGVGQFQVLAGSYSYPVSDANGCQTSTGIQISEPAILLASATATPILCYGGNSIVTVSAIGGTAPYTGTGQYTVQAGNHSYTITDANGCMAVTSIQVNQPAQLIASSVSTNALCFGGMGTALVSASGGTAPYSGIGSFIVPVGTTPFGVTDANGCQAGTSVVVTQPSLLNLNLIGSDVTTYGGSDGSVNLSVSGGTIPYYYSWSNGANSEDIFNLPAGIYSVTVTDQNGCTAQASIQIYAPSVLPLEISLFGTNNICFGACQGTIDLNISGGVPPYSYAWSNGANSQDLFNLCAGVYSVTVTDAAQFVAYGSMVISEPSQIVVTTSAQPILCNGLTTMVSVSAQGGTQPYSGTGLFQAFAGNHNYTVTDANGCTGVGNIQLNQPDPLTAEAVAGIIPCYGGQTIVEVMAFGGTLPYTGIGSFTVGAGNYVYDVTDANGCHTSVGVNVAEPGLLTASASATAILCTGGTSLVQVTATGGTAPYSGTGSFEVGAGTHTFTVTDANGCSSVAGVEVSEPLPLSIDAQYSPIMCFGGVSTISISANGGTAPYDGVGMVQVGAGVHPLTVTDANGCTASTILQIGEPSELVGQYTYTPILCYGGTSSVAISAIGGVQPYTGTGVFNMGAGDQMFVVTDANGCSIQIGFSIPGPALLEVEAFASPILCYGEMTNVQVAAMGGTPPYSGVGVYEVGAGSYSYEVIDANGCHGFANIEIGQPEPLVVNVSNTPILCFGGSSEVTVSATGGTAPYFGVGLFEAEAGVHYYYVYDSNGCFGYDVAQIGQPSELVAVGEATQILCNGGVSTVTIFASGGMAPYSGTGVFQVSAGTHSFVVTDANGCTDEVSITVIQPEILSASANFNPILCNGDLTTILLTASGGIEPYTGTGSFVVGAGNYDYQVTDANGCVVNLQVQVTEPALLVSQAEASPILCANGTSMVVVTASGGVAPYQGVGTYELGAGFYAFEVTDANGCMNFASVGIEEPSVLSAFTQVFVIPCSGGMADVEVTAEGGTPPYSGTGLFERNPGSWSFPVTDANGCTVIAEVVVEAQNQLVATANAGQIACFGGQTMVSVNASGGAFPYYGTGQFYVGAGVHQFFVTDAEGCIDDVTVTVTQPALLMVSGSVFMYPNGYNTTCGVCSDGMIDLTVSGGTPPYVANWNNGANTQDLNGISAGSYAVTVFDAHGCMGSYAAEVTAPPSLQVIVQATSDYNGYDVSCNGSADGSVAAFIYGVSGEVGYLWSNGQTTQTLSNVSAGNYQVTVTYNPQGSTGGAFDWNYTVTSANHIVLIPGSGVNINNQLISVGDYIGAFFNSPNGLVCGGYLQFNGYDDAIALWGDDSQTVGVKDGFAENDQILWKVWRAVDGITVEMDPVYDPNWPNQGNFASNGISGLLSLTGTSSSTYAIGSVDVTQPPVLGVQGVVSNESCGGFANGSISLSIYGGVGPYSIIWSNGAQGTTISNLAPGSYSCTVMDANGCLAYGQFVVTGPMVLVVSGQVNNVACNGGTNGSVALNVSGGIPPYAFSWSNGAVSQNIVNLGPGTYSVVVTDATGCTKGASFTVTMPQAIALTNVNTNVACYGSSTGSVDLTVIGGTMPYSYVWSNGSTGADLNNVGAGTYKVTVTDANGCVKISNNFVLTQPFPITISRTITNVSCFGGFNGLVNITVNGGTVPYTYIWSNGITVQDANQVPAGVYSVTVTDQNGCNAFGTYTVTQPTQISVSGNVTNILCNGMTNGAITLTTSGGTPSYSYFWSTGVFVKDISGLPSGTYSVSVTDSKGCLVSNSFTVTQPAVLNATASVSQYGVFNVSAWNATDGFIVVNGTGGTAPYSYLWGNGATTSFRNSLGSGVYGVTIVDAHQCSIVRNYTLTAPPQPIPLSASISQVGNVTCFGGNNGTAAVSATGGTPPYYYSWSSVPAQYGNTAYGLAAGVYSVTVSDALGASVVKTTTITQPTNLVATVTSSNVTCAGGTNGSASLIVSGGVAPYSYYWTGGATTQNLVNRPAGTYTVVVTDSHGCIAVGSAVISQPTPVVVSLSASPALCFGSATGSASATVSGGVGPYSFVWNNGTVGAVNSNVISGNYWVTVTDSNGCSAVGTVFVGQPSLFILSNTAVNPTCPGTADGSIDLTVTGGVAPYTALWNDNVTSFDRLGLGAGIYGVTVTDNNGCTTSQVISLSDPTAIVVTGVVSNVTCPENNDGSIDITSNTNGLSFNWSNYSSMPDQYGLPSGVYYVTATSQAGCFGTASFTISEPAGIELSYVVSHVSCFGSSNGSIDLEVSGGTAPYDYYWLTGQVSEDLYGLSSGFYKVIVVDANGCSVISEIITITEPGPIVVTANVVDVSCAGGSNGLIDLAISGGTAPYVVNWSNGMVGEDIANLTAGVYSATIVDANGCSHLITRTVLDGGSLSLSATRVNVSCNGGSNGSIDLTVTGAVGSLSYLWAGPSGSFYTQDINGLLAGVYQVTVTQSGAACNSSAVLVVTITQPAPLALSITTAISGSYRILTAVVSGGVSPYTYFWTYTTGSGTYNSSSTKLKVPVGTTYSLLVTDFNGCTINASGVASTMTSLIAGGSDDPGEKIDASEEFLTSLDEQNVLDCKAYPNPSSDGFFTIEISGGIVGEGSLVILDAQGRIVYNKEFSGMQGNEITLDLSSLKSGMYQMKLSDEIGFSILKRLIISK